MSHVLSVECSDLNIYFEKFKKNGYSIHFKEDIYNEHIKSLAHEMTRTKFQKLFNLNKYKEA